ncbi:hypothetical protein H8356DRAFT_1750007 [Neocallimastix lanati (nom. inval.)]|nr:hypothetical protein H8356DRAFT_1750007 [Neocallimastix sp. JGI-2020a]
MDIRNINIHIKPIYDITFKNLFGVEGNELILIHFLNQILGQYLNVEKVDNIGLITNKKKRGRPSTKVPKYFTKTSKMDIHDNDNNEMNNINIKSVLFYNNFQNFLDLKLDDLLNYLFKPEENDSVINMEATTKDDERINIEIQINEDLVMINILNFNLLNNTKEEMTIPHWEFTLKDKNTNEEKGFKDLLNIHFIELPKYKEYANYTNKREKEIMDEKSKMEGKYDEGLIKGEKLKEIKDDYKEIFTEEELEINSFVEDKSYKIKDLALQLDLDEDIILEVCEKVNLDVQERKEKKRKIKIKYF